MTHAVVPVILEPVQDTTVTVDQFTVAQFLCSAAGIPQPMISLVRVMENGSTVELTSEMDDRVAFSIPILNEYYLLEDGVTSFNVVGDIFLANHTLTLNGTMDSDSGTYRCVARNAAGNDTQNFELVVQGKFCMSYSVGSIKKPPMMKLAR